MGKVYFVSGIDTGVGKTMATGMMARFLRKAGQTVMTVKLVQTGCHGFSEDLDMHRKLMKCPPFPEDKEGLTAPAIFDFPASPHFAAARERRQVDVEAIVHAIRQVSERNGITLTEGAGGLAVPLTEELLTVDLAARESWEAILVCSGKLGSLNHAILSLEALKARNMKLAGVVYNYCPEADAEIEADTERMLGKYLERYGFGKRIVRLGRVDPEHPEESDTDFSAIFREIRP